MKLLENKTALITGATRGIGYATALRFAQEGCNVAFTFLKRNDLVEKVCKEIESYGVRALGLASDATDFRSAEQVVKAVIEKMGKIDILVNNAGKVKDGLMLRMSEEQWDSVITGNLKSTFNYIHAVAPHMLRAKAGSIISLSSSVALLGNVGQSNYATAKAGLIGLTRSLAKEFGSRNVRVNVVAPGLIETDMTDFMSQDYKQQIIDRICLNRVGKPDDVAKVILFLASDLASYITGVTIPVTGGLS